MNIEWLVLGVIAAYVFFHHDTAAAAAAVGTQNGTAPVNPAQNNVAVRTALGGGGIGGGSNGDVVGNVGNTGFAGSGYGKGGGNNTGVSDPYGPLNPQRLGGTGIIDSFGPGVQGGLGSNAVGGAGMTPPAQLGIDTQGTLLRTGYVIGAGY